MAGSPTFPLHSSPQRSPHHRPGAVPASPLTCLAPPRSPRGLRAPATPQRRGARGSAAGSAAGAAADPQLRPGEPLGGLGARPRPALLLPPPAAATAPRARAAAGSAPGARGHRGGGSSRAGAHRDTGALARHRAAFIDDPPRASHGGAFGRLLGLRLLPLVLRLHGGEEQHLLQRATPSARATPPARRAQRKSRESAARLGPAPARGRERRSAARAASGGGATPAASRAPLGGTVWQLASRPQLAPPLPFTLMLLESVRNMAKRSIPMPQPAVGGRPYSSAVQKFSSINMASSSPAAFA